MSKQSNIHFEISERKILFSLFDILVVGFALYGLSYFTGFDYFKIDVNNWTWLVVFNNIYLRFWNHF